MRESSGFNFRDAVVMEINLRCFIRDVIGRDFFQVSSVVVVRFILVTENGCQVNESQS